MFVNTEVSFPLVFNLHTFRICVRCYDQPLSDHVTQHDALYGFPYDRDSTAKVFAYILLANDYSPLPFLKKATMQLKFSGCHVNLCECTLFKTLNLNGFDKRFKVIWL